MVNLTKIYTRTGDDGTTSLGDFSRTSKNDHRLHAYADTNEANAAIGIAIAAGGLEDDVKATLLRVQNELFDVGADLSTPLQETYEYPPLRVDQPWIDDLERDCDHYLERLEKLRSFILPGGTAGSSYLHLATTIVRRAERSAWAAIEAHATGVRLFAFRSRKAELSCDDLVHGRKEAEAAPKVLKGHKGLSPAQVSRAALFAAEVQKELAAEIKRRGCRA